METVSKGTVLRELQLSIVDSCGETLKMWGGHMGISSSVNILAFRHWDVILLFLGGAGHGTNRNTVIAPSDKWTNSRQILPR